MRTRTLKAVRATVVAGVVAGALAAAPVAFARQEPPPGGCTAADQLIEELVRTEAVFHKATAGSPAQFRAREAAYDLREKLFSGG